jgi:hypothetical protein
LFSLPVSNAIGESNYFIPKQGISYLLIFIPLAKKDADGKVIT